MKIGIIVAMESEYAQILGLLGGKPEGRIGNNDIVLRRSGMGKVNAAVGAVSLIGECAPDCIISAACNGKRGNPCIFPKRFFEELMQLREDHGGNTVIKKHPESLVTVEVAKAELTDVDTPEALNELKKDGV